MKSQILSRIQSYQNIPTHPQISNPKISSTQTVQLYNEPRLSKCTIIEKQSPNKVLKIQSPPPKLLNQRFFLSNGNLSSNKKPLTTISKDNKKSLNENAKNQIFIRNTKIVKRLSEKYFPLTNFEKSEEKGLENTQNNNNFICQNVQTETYKKINCDLLKEVNRNNSARRKKLMIMYSKGNRSGKSAITSQQTIKIAHDDPRDPQANLGKTMNSTMKTIDVLKDYKKNPYFHLSQKKFSIKSINAAKSLSRIPTLALTQKSQVSIELIDDQNVSEIQKQQEANANKESLQFGCSEIKEKLICNDSCFLEEEQKNLICDMESKTDKSKIEEMRRRKWKKLPTDFLKN